MPKIIQELQALPGRTRSRALRNVTEATNLFVSELKITLGRQGSPGVHSRPGEPPRRQSGRLQREVHGVIDARALTGKVIVPTPYGWPLEYGRKSYPFTSPRPFIAPTRRRIKAQIDRIMKKRFF